MEVRFMNGSLSQETLLKQEIMLQINERLYVRSLISRDLYERAKLKIMEALVG